MGLAENINQYVYTVAANKVLQFKTLGFGGFSINHESFS